ncbi:MAG: hypothetical protein JXJ04_05595 [Spirochaetales bacterium]|nr:hypothetical protein [Spirochaetales bacterium]
MRKFIILSLIVLSLFSGCSRKADNKGNGGQFEGAFAYEKRVILDLIDVLQRYNSRIFQASTTEEMTKANDELSDKLEVLNPEILFVTEKHPDWGKNPPEELKTMIQKYLNANQDFGTMSLDLVKLKIESNPDDDELIRSFERLKDITKRDKK